MLSIGGCACYTIHRRGCAWFTWHNGPFYQRSYAYNCGCWPRPPEVEHTKGENELSSTSGTLVSDLYIMQT